MLEDHAYLNESSMPSRLLLDSWCLMQAMAEPRSTHDSQPETDEKLGQSLIRGSGDRHYNVNWSDHTETDQDYLVYATKKWWRKEREE